MKKKALSNLLQGKIFQIPDYQREYAWEELQLQDFDGIKSFSKQIIG